MSERFHNWRRHSRFRPLFFLFFILGPFVVLPFLIISPAIVTFRAAWSKQPRLLWRFSAVCTIVLAVLITQPSSPLFWRLDFPIPPQDQISGGLSWLLEMQRPYLNGAVLSLAVAMPFSAASAIHSVRTRGHISNRGT